MGVTHTHTHPHTYPQELLAAGHPRDEESLMRTGLRDSALRRVRSVAARRRGMPSLAEVPAQEGTAQGQGEQNGGEGVPSEELSPRDCHASPRPPAVSATLPASNMPRG